MKISFDFDFTLSEPLIRQIAKRFIQHGDEVFITTSRSPKGNNDLFEVADNLGIPRANIRFTSGEDKYEFLDGFDAHFDDDIIEIELIKESKIKCQGFHFDH